jgi:hypothetical protein
MGGSKALKTLTQEEGRIPRTIRRRENTKEEKVQNIMTKDEMKRGGEQERTNK